MNILKSIDVLEIVDRLKSGQIGILPTDTVYGIVGICDFCDISVRNKIYEVKKRDILKPLVLQIGLNYNILDVIDKIDSVADKIMKKFFPGALTIIFNTNEKFRSFYNWNTIGIRIPKNDLLLDILDILQKPLFVTSANISGDSQNYDFEKLKEIFFSSVDFIVKETKKKSNIPSTIVDLSRDKIFILREGEISKDKIFEIIKVNK